MTVATIVCFINMIWTSYIAERNFQKSVAKCRSLSDEISESDQNGAQTVLVLDDNIDERGKWNKRASMHSMVLISMEKTGRKQRLFNFIGSLLGSASISGATNQKSTFASTSV